MRILICEPDCIVLELLSHIENRIRFGGVLIEIGTESPPRRPLEPDTVSTVEGRNSHP